MRRLVISFSLIFLGICVVSDPGFAQSSQTAELADVLDRLRATENVPGATAAVVSAAGSLRAGATGYADLIDSTRMHADARMLSGSTGKSFVAAVVLSLAREGALPLDAPIAQWLGDRSWFHRLPNGDAITLRMLLRHQSGLPDHIYSPAFQRAAQQRMEEQGPDASFTPERLVSFILDRDPLFPAGSGYHYSDTNYILAGLIIEDVTGDDYYAVLTRRLLEPLGLTHTAPANRRDLPGLVPGYNMTDGPFGLPRHVMANGLLVYNPAIEWTGGGLVTNPQDLARWAKALYEGDALPGEYREDLFDAVPKDSTQQLRYGPNVRYGLGVTIRSTSLGPAYGHRGWTPGYRSIFEYYPEHKIAVAIQVNATGSYDLTDYAVRLAQTVRGLQP